MSKARIRMPLRRPSSRAVGIGAEDRPPVCGFFDIRRDADGGTHIETWVKGFALLRFVLVNKGTAFTQKERRELGLDGLLPSRVTTMADQLDRAYVQFSGCHTNIEKYQYLRGLQERQEILFYALIEKHLVEMLPIIYTPTVGEAVEKFSALFQSPRGLTVNPDNIDHIDDVLAGYPLYDVRMIVATDSSAILGIGDQGYGGLAISIGKLSLYTVGGGISPFHSMPVGLDVGTDRKELLENPNYLGAPRQRMTGDEYIAFLDRFVASVKKRWPAAIIQWEDLAKDSAFTVLERYRDELPSFNDDIQGTGAVALAGLISACRVKGEALAAQRYLVYGAGAGGIGVALSIRDGLMAEGLSEEDAVASIFVLDSRGLLLKSRSMEPYKAEFAQPDERVADWSYDGAAPGLLETVKGAKITALIGLSGQKGSFNEEIIGAVMENTEEPIVFPLSNPTRLAEAIPAHVIQQTDGRALVATGSPFDPVQHGTRTIDIGQGNNAFIFPGLGLGTLLSGASKISAPMVLAAAHALARFTLDTYGQTTLLYPPLSDLQTVSQHVAVAVMEAAHREGVAAVDLPPEGERLEYVKSRFWLPEYLPIVHTTESEALKRDEAENE